MVFKFNSNLKLKLPGCQGMLFESKKNLFFRNVSLPGNKPPIVPCSRRKSDVQGLTFITMEGPDTATGDMGTEPQEEGEVTSKPLEDDYRKLKQLTAVIFGLLIVTSVSTSILCIAFWLNLSKLEQLTNTFSAFFGFMTASLISLVAGICGLFDLYETPNYESHSMAVVWLLVSSIFFNIVFPTTAFLPIGVDNSKRIPTMSLQECIPESNLPECSDADNLRIVLYCMYIPILLVLAVLIYYCIVWRRRRIQVTLESEELPPDLEDEVSTEVKDRIRIRDNIDETAASFSEFY